MDKKTLNALKKKAAKQEAAKSLLLDARRNGVAAVAALVLDGNSYVRQVFDGVALAPGVEPFPATKEEVDECVSLIRSRRRADLAAAKDEAERALFRKAMDAYSEGRLVDSYRILSDLDRPK